MFLIIAMILCPPFLSPIVITAFFSAGVKKWFRTRCADLGIDPCACVTQFTPSAWPASLALTYTRANLVVSINFSDDSALSVRTDMRVESGKLHVGDFYLNVILDAFAPHNMAADSFFLY